MVDTQAPSTLATDDVVAIVQLAAAYCCGVDAPDRDVLRGIFDDEVQFVFPADAVTGRDELVERLATSGRGTHVSTAPFVTATADGATGRSRFVYVSTDGRIVTGGYDDVYRRTPSGWRIARRAVVVTAAVAL